MKLENGLTSPAIHLDMAYAILGETRNFDASGFFIFEIVRELCDLQEEVENGFCSIWIVMCDRQFPTNSSPQIG